MAGLVELPSVAQLERVLLDSVNLEPDSQRIVRPDWIQVRTPSSQRHSHNVVLRARLAPNEVASKVAEVVAEHKARGAGFRWIVAPSSSPASLGEHIASAGLVQLGNATVGMALSVPAAERPLSIDGLTIEVVGHHNVDAHAELTARCWQEGSAFRDTIAYMSRRALSTPADAPSRTQSWIASLHGEPVATSHLRFLPDVGYLQGAAVLPTHRRRGIYRALIHHRLNVLRRAGKPIAVVWADADGSAIVCRKVGFTELARANFYKSAIRPPGP